MDRNFAWLPDFHRVEVFKSNIALYENSQGESRVIKKLADIPNHQNWIDSVIKNQQRARHHNIVSWLGHHQDNEGNHYLQFEHLRGGSLERLLTRTKLSPPIIQKWTRDLTAALAHLKTLTIVHRCVHPSNIYLSDDRLSRADAKLGYFSYSKKSLKNAQVSTTFEPDELYTAPELLNRTSEGLPVDVWSLGCVVHFMFTGKASRGPDPCNSVIPPDAQDFIAKCCVADVRYRIDISVAQNHPFLTGIASQILTPIPPEEVLEEMEKIDAACRETEESEKRQKLIASITEQVKEAIVQVDKYTELLSVYEGKTLADDYAIDLGSMIQALSRQFPALQAQANKLQSQLSQKADELLDRVRAA